jgi:hypothetical protein
MAVKLSALRAQVCRLYMLLEALFVGKLDWQDLCPGLTLRGPDSSLEEKAKS